LEDVLICPKTKNRVTVDTGNSIVRVEEADVTYPIKDGIIDFLPDIDDRISRSYDSIASFYDDYITSSGPKWKLVTLIAWGFSGDDQFTQQFLSLIPDDFDGLLMDVPVGTGIFTFKKYRKLEKAQIIAIDYSLGMLRKAQQVYAEHGIQNVTLIRGDVGNLPIDEARVDLCSSMNGFHAFPEKTLALREIAKTLKTDGRFMGCFYIRGKRKLTDLLVQKVLSKQGTFTAPFYDEAETLSRFGEYFTARSTANVKSIFYFDMERK
jgi:ubiquinone/menaquinone biosynthesis C-methylase UbiE